MTPVRTLPQSDVLKLTNLAAKEAAELGYPRRATIVRTTDAALGRFGRDIGRYAGIPIYLVVLPTPGGWVFASGPSAIHRVRPNFPFGMGDSTVFEFRASDLSQMDYEWGVFGRGLEKLGPHIDVQLR